MDKSGKNKHIYIVFILNTQIGVLFFYWFISSRMGVPLTGDNTWRDGDTAAVDDVDTKVPLYIYIQIHMYTCSQYNFTFI